MSISDIFPYFCMVLHIRIKTIVKTKYTDHYTHTLPCGLRIICVPGATDVAYCGIAIDAGTRDELDTESGMAHFAEHLSFKGTKRRKSWHIINRMESVGGDLNAFTGKEETVYYCTCLKSHLPRAIDVLADIVLNSTYPQSEMDKEVEVVAGEIESYNDSPSELIYDEFENLLFKGHPLGRSILGKADRLRQYTTDDVLHYARRLYTPKNMVLFVHGKVDPSRVIRLAEKAFAGYSSDNTTEDTAEKRTPLPLFLPQTVEMDMDTHQAHVMMGRRTYGATHPRHTAMFVLNHILGGPGMNSRLCQSLREKNGLVYTVESTLTTYTDTGVWAIYFGCEPSKVQRCRKLVLKELERLTAAPLTPTALAAVKKQIKGQVGISYDNFENVAIGMAKRFLHYNKTLTPKQLCARIDALTAEELWQTACEMFDPQQLTQLIFR